MLNALTGTSGRAKVEMLQLLFTYLFGGIRKNELKQDFRAKGFDPVKLGLVQNGYVCRNCKLFVYALHTGSPLTADAFGVERKDTKALKWVAQHITIPEGCPVWDLPHLERNENALVHGLKTYIGKFISKKMAFLLKSYGLHRQDIEMELYCAALWAIHKRYPFFESALHAVNIAKSAIHNRGMDVIASYTREKNQRLIRNSDGTFESVNIDVSVLSSLQAPEPFELRYRDERSGLRSLQKIMNDKGALYISLARGEYNADFSDYIGLNNTEAAEGNYHAYLRKIDRFLRVTQEERTQFFNKIKDVI
jgi:hypothetical protein